MHAALEKEFAGAADVAFFHLQTVWEGHDTNTPKNGPRAAAKFTKAPVAYDGRVDGAHVSLFMSQYGTGGTPWTIVIDKRRVVQHNSVTPQSGAALQKLIAKAELAVL